jgi:hypothetical protein
VAERRAARLRPDPREEERLGAIITNPKAHHDGDTFPTGRELVSRALAVYRALRRNAPESSSASAPIRRAPSFGSGTVGVPQVPLGQTSQ